MNKIYIVIKEYNAKLAKRQPWYTINCLVKDLERKGQSVEIISSLEDLPNNFSGKVIKTFSLKDCFSRDPKKYRLIYLITFPIYSFSKFLKIPLRTTLENWKDLKRIFIVSTLPKSLLKTTLERADDVIVISDRSEEYLNSFIPTKKIIPFSFNNWGGFKKEKIDNSTKTIGYFGPPFTTRNFDKIIDFFLWLNKSDIRLKKKLITRIERDELKHTEGKYLSKLKNDSSLKIVSGFLDRSFLAKELMEVDVLLLPFKIVMSELPIVVLEALELGIPVVTTKDSGISKIAFSQKNLLVLDSFSKKQYPKIINFIRENPVGTFEELKKDIIDLNETTLSSICQN